MKILNKLGKIILVQVLFGLLFAFIYTSTCKKEDFRGKKHDGLNTNNFFENFYFSTVTMFTVGYGGVHPYSRRARTINTIHHYMSRVIMMNVITQI